MDKSTSGSSMIQRKVAQQLEDPADLCDFPLGISIWSQFTSDCLWAWFWLSKDHEDWKRMATNKTFHKNTRFNAVRATASANTDRRHSCIQHADIAGLANISLFKHYVAGWYSSKIDQDESSRVPRFYAVCWNLKSKSIQQLGNKTGWPMEWTWICRKSSLAAREV